MSTASLYLAAFRQRLREALLFIRKLLIDSESYLPDWPPPFNVDASSSKSNDHHFALRGDNDDEVREKLKDQQRKYWVFKFVDLVFVALLSKLSKVLEYCALSFHSYLFVTSLFCLLFVTRMTADEYGVQFIAHDSFHIICYFVYFMSNFIMSLNINVLENDDHQDASCKANFVSFGFSVGFLASRAVILILFYRVVFEDELWKESSQMTLGHEVVVGLWSEEDARGNFTPDEKCRKHEFEDCDETKGECIRCKRHDECFWACKDSANTILQRYPISKGSFEAPDELQYNLHMLGILKDAIIARLVRLKNPNTKQPPLLYPAPLETALTSREKRKLERVYFNENDKSSNLFDISIEEDVNAFVEYIVMMFGEDGKGCAELFGVNGDDIIPLAPDWFNESMTEVGYGPVGGWECMCAELTREMSARCQDVDLVHSIFSRFFRSGEDDNYDSGLKGLDVQDKLFEALTERLEDATKVRNERIATKGTNWLLDIAKCRNLLVSKLMPSVEEQKAAKMRKFLLDDRDKFLRLARLHCFALQGGPNPEDEFITRKFGKCLYVTFYALLDEFQADKVSSVICMRHVCHRKA